MPSISLSANPSVADFFQKSANANANSPVALEQKLAQCQRKLGDWEACPSGKSPEGKRIIQNLQDQVRSIESSIAKVNNAGSTDTFNVLQAPPRSVSGRILDVYA